MCVKYAARITVAAFNCVKYTARLTVVSLNCAHLCCFGAQACELFLMNRSAITKYNVRQLKVEGNTTLYVRRLCEVFFSALTNTCKEFLKAFPELYGCFSCEPIFFSTPLSCTGAVILDGTRSRNPLQTFRCY